MSDLKLPAISGDSSAMLNKLMASLGLPRDIIASDIEIEYAWHNLPRELQQIPKDKLNVLLVRMCVAASTGLFDSAINYAWNCAILELRNRVRNFGLAVVPQITGKPFDEEKLNEMRDAELLELCVSLNLITEEGFFFLNQCREVRNNFSAAHPPVASIDDREFINFLSRCTKYALAGSVNPRGVDTREFLSALKNGKFSVEQEEEWTNRLNITHDQQREILFGTLHGIYCDSNSTQETRLNALAVALRLGDMLTPRAKTDMVDRHSAYLAKGEADKHRASRQFIAHLQLLPLLGATERHIIISNSCKSLMGVHNAMDNFYNEPPFAKQLLEYSKQGAIPDSVQDVYVESVVTCAIGNPYGVSRAALPYYDEMIRNFSPREISIMLQLLNSNSKQVGIRVNDHLTCRRRAGRLLELLDPKSIPTSSVRIYNQLMGRVAKSL